VRDQLETWKGSFGTEYTDRNAVDWRSRVPLFQRMLKRTSFRTVLEVGCNRGHNLRALQKILGPKARVMGIEPNPYARALAHVAAPLAEVIAGDICHLPLKNRSVDLAFTWGVLIHVPFESLGIALQEIHRVSSTYALAVEYFAEEETAIRYRGHDNLLWKRNFLRHYQERFPRLRLLEEGHWGPEVGEDRVSWWLFEKA
jgi:pseudaminic acid biosynthesis-associated methylase